jgi:ABC-type lipoprotein export system ATPase subunit
MLELNNVVKIYTTVAGDTAAMNGVSIKFPDTGMVFITGKSGSGKTTLLNVVGGLDGFDSGEIIIDGKNFSTFTAKEYDSYRNTFVGFIFQEYNLLPDYTVEKNIRIANELQGKQTSSEEIARLLEEFDIAGLQHRKPSELSGGQKQRVAIVRSLVKDPKIIMADEPTGALDSATGIQVMETLKKLSKTKLIIVVSHDMELSERYADRIIRLVDGEIVEDVTITDSEIKGNIYQDENILTVKSGASLDPHETEQLLKAIREKKKIAFTEKFSIRKKEKTKEVVTSSDVGNIELINSKMKIKSAAELGLKSLKVKPGRLIFTIFLSVIAFAVFGLFDTIAAYNDSRAIEKLLKDSEYSAISITTDYYSDEYQGNSIRISKESVEKYKNDFGYDFRPVYDIYDATLASTNAKSNLVNLKDPQASAKGSMYFYDYVTGFVEFKNDELVRNENGVVSTIDPSGFNLKLVHGNFPTTKIENGALINGTMTDIAISEFLARSIAYWKQITDIKELIEYKIQIRNKEYTIKGIYSCGSIPTKYNPLMIAEPTGVNNPLAEDFQTFIYSGLYLNVFVPEGYMDVLVNENNRIAPCYAGDRVYKFTYEDLKSRTYNIAEYGKFYNAKDVDKSKVMFFDLERNNGKTYNLADNEILINLESLTTMFIKEVEIMSKPPKDFDHTSNEYNNIVKDLLGLKSSYMTETMRQKFAEFLELTKKAMEYNSNGRTANLERNVEMAKVNDGLTVSNHLYKIVGVYTGVNTDDSISTNAANTAMNPVVMNGNDLEEIGVYSEQGIYGRMVAPLVKNKKGARAMAKEMTVYEGLKLSWFGNTILDTIRVNGEFIELFAQLFLYVSLVLALFSIFMLFNYISASIVSKRQSIGVLRALGSGGKDIFLMFITESLVIALINAVLASGVAAVGCIFVNHYIKTQMNLVIDFALFGVRQIIIILATSIVTAVLSSLIPIIKIAKEKPVKLIREP